MIFNQRWLCSLFYLQTSPAQTKFTHSALGWNIHFPAISYCQGNTVNLDIPFDVNKYNFSIHFEATVSVTISGIDTKSVLSVFSAHYSQHEYHCMNFKTISDFHIVVSFKETVGSARFPSSQTYPSTCSTQTDKCRCLCSFSWLISGQF